MISGTTIGSFPFNFYDIPILLDSQEDFTSSFPCHVQDIPTEPDSHSSPPLSPILENISPSIKMGIKRKKVGIKRKVKSILKRTLKQSSAPYPTSKKKCVNWSHTHKARLLISEAPTKKEIIDEDVLIKEIPIDEEIADGGAHHFFLKYKAIDYNKPASQTQELRTPRCEKR